MCGDEDVVRVEQALAELQRLVDSPRVHAARAQSTGVALTRTELRVLGHVVDRGPSPVTRIAGVLDVSQPTASRTLGRLEREGLLRRQADESDARVVRYAATANGRRAREKVRAHMRGELVKALADLGGERAHVLAGLLDDFVVRLQRDR